MTRAPSVSETLTVYVPFRIVKRGGRKEMVLPTTATAQRKPDDTFVKALARAFRWKQLLDSGEFATITDLAEREKGMHSLIASDQIDQIPAAFRKISG